MIYLKQSTASQEVLLGPFVDSTDGVTAETALSIANTDIKIFKAGATTLASKNSGGATHISNGNYYAVLDATDTDTVGSGTIVVQVSGALAVRHDFTVLPAVPYDSLIGGTDTLTVDVTQFNGTNGTFSAGRPEVNTTHAAGTAWASGAITAAAIADGAIDLATFAADAKALLGVVAFGTAQSVTGTTIVLAAGETFASSELIGATVIIRSATTGQGQSRVITAYNGGTDTATVDTWTTTPTGTITYIIVATPPASTSVPIPANTTQFAGTAITSAAGIPEVKVASLAANSITATAIATDAITAAKVAADAVTEIQFGLATAAALTVVDDFLDTEIAAIKAKTDSLTFTVAGQVDANIQSVNDVTVTGNGGAGTEWGP